MATANPPEPTEGRPEGPSIAAAPDYSSSVATLVNFVETTFPALRLMKAEGLNDLVKVNRHYESPGGEIVLDWEIVALNDGGGIKATFMGFQATNRMVHIRFLSICQANPSRLADNEVAIEPPKITRFDELAVLHQIGVRAVGRPLRNPS